MSCIVFHTTNKDPHMRHFAAILILMFTLNALHSQPKAAILIAYYSQDGHTKLMAEAVAKGARSVRDVTVKLMTVNDVSKEDLLGADAIIVGSPVHNANAAVDVIRFINSWPFEGAPLSDKVGGAFVTAGGISAGEELTQMNILHSMLVYGMIVVGGADWTSAFGASAVTAEKPFGRSQKEIVVAEQFLQKGEGLGKRVAGLAARLNRAR
jgi:NAD(P)H dehydrogenase (quinone)